MAGNYLQPQIQMAMFYLSYLQDYLLRVTGTARSAFEEVGDREPDFNVGFVNSFTLFSNWNLIFQP
jgi:hypothetical protein